MENYTQKTIGTDLFSTVIGLLIVGALFALHENSIYWLLPFAAIDLVILIVYILRHTVFKTNEILVSDICKKLDKSGFRHEKKDGTLYVSKDDCHFRVHINDSFNKRIKHLYVLYEFADEGFTKVTMDGWGRASNSINVNNTNTTFVTLDDHFCCCYQSAIGNSKDFMKEFGRAYQAIGGVMDDFRKLYPYLERDYPNKTENKGTIGFK